jgi:hypothetical protein
VALLNDCRPLGKLPLDQLVMVSFLVPPPPDAFNLAEEADRQLTRDSLNALLQYRSAEHVKQFNLLLTTVLKPPNDADAEQAFKLLQTLPGGREFLNGNNENLQAYFMETSLARRQQLLAHERIAALGQAWHLDWTRHIFPKLESPARDWEISRHPPWMRRTHKRAPRPSACSSANGNFPAPAFSSATPATRGSPNGSAPSTATSRCPLIAMR